jgi:tRNA pseudouridine38-40 synthase
MRYFLQIQYKGTHYNGWQVQENTPNTVEQVLEEKLALILQEKVDVIGCGRTDTGVHAGNFFAHFDSEFDLIPDKKQRLFKFNTVLPEDISVLNILKVKNEAHARFDATSRTYHYFLNQQKNPFLENTSWFLYGEIDFELMNKAAEILLQTSDFTSFSKLNTQTKTNVCKVTYAKWERLNENEWRFVITADRFLRNMVRAIVGTLLLVGRKKITIEEFKKIIEQKNRSEAGMSVPAHALFLTAITYPESIFSE